MGMSEKVQKEFEDLTDAADAVANSGYRDIQYNLRQFLQAIDDSRFISNASTQLPQVDFDAWHNAALLTVGGMVGTGKLEWPEAKNDRIAIQLATIRFVAQKESSFSAFAHNFTYGGQHIDDDAHIFIERIFEPFFRDFVRHCDRQLENKEMEQEQTDVPIIKVFVSHSSNDAELAIALIALIRAALNLTAQQIRCTSVHGYKLPIGANTNEQLRAELTHAIAFVGIISPLSIDSIYVTFELGGRWGVNRPILPLLSKGEPGQLMQGPLSGTNALCCNRREDLQQFVHDLGRILGIPPEEPAVFERNIEAILRLESADDMPAAAGAIESDQQKSKLSDGEIEILRMSGERAQGMTAVEIQAELDISPQKSTFLIDELQEKRLLSSVGSLDPMYPTMYPLTHKGRRFLVDENLL